MGTLLLISIFGYGFEQGGRATVGEMSPRRLGEVSKKAIRAPIDAFSAVERKLEPEEAKAILRSEDYHRAKRIIAQAAAETCFASAEKLWGAIQPNSFGQSGDVSVRERLSIKEALALRRLAKARFGDPKPVRLLIPFVDASSAKCGESSVDLDLLADTPLDEAKGASDQSSFQVPEERREAN